MLKIKRALISVSNKEGLEDLVKTLNELGVEILSTGGTAKKIKELGIPVRDVSDYTGFPEMMDGRVKTLHPKIHAGLLALRDNLSHMEEAKKHNIDMIDMVVVNLYPFEETVAKEGVTVEEAIENIDIGGPSMLRSAAKNYKSVAVVMDSKKYPQIIKELKENEGSLSESTLKNLGVEVFKRTSEYDRAIYNYLSYKQKAKSYKLEDFPAKLNLNFEKVQDLRYGENPHQRAAFYKDNFSLSFSIADMRQIQGKELSFNNILDLDAAIKIVREFKNPAASIIKHTNPCGAAEADNLSKAYLDALECDRLSAFGSIVGFNRQVDKELAEIIIKEAGFIECIIGPSFSKEAKDIFSKKKNLRLLELPNFNPSQKSPTFRSRDECNFSLLGRESRPKGSGSSTKINDKELDFRKVSGGLLIQDMDSKIVSEADLKIVTKKLPSQEEIDALLFGYKIVKHIKSNAIVICKGTKTVGVGAGQMSRVDSVIIASRKAGQRAQGAVLASDAFFPKPDAIEQAYKAGIKAIIQPGGSIRDQEIITACNSFGISMVFTGVRHFKH